METFGTTRDCLEEALTRTIATLSAVGLFSEKTEKGATLYTVKRDLFRGIEKSLEEKIEEMGSRGGVRTRSTQLSSGMRRLRTKISCPPSR